MSVNLGINMASGEKKENTGAGRNEEGAQATGAETKENQRDREDAHKDLGCACVLKLSVRTVSPSRSHHSGYKSDKKATSTGGMSTVAWVHSDSESW